MFWASGKESTNEEIPVKVQTFTTVPVHCGRRLAEAFELSEVRVQIHFAIVELPSGSVDEAPLKVTFAPGRWVRGVTVRAATGLLFDPPTETSTEPVIVPEVAVTVASVLVVRTSRAIPSP